MQGGGKSRRQESMAAGIGSSARKHIHAPPHLRLGAFSWQRLQPHWQKPLGTPQTRGDSPACRGMGVSEGFPRPGQGGDRVPVPLDGSGPAPIALPLRFLRIPAPARGPPAPRHPRCARDRLSVPASLGKTRGARAPAKGSFAMRGDGGDGPPRLRRLPETKSCLSLPSPPARAFGFLLFFFPFLFSPIPLQRACCFSLAHLKRQGCKIRQMHSPNAG